jgi:hypothetical protein
VKTPLGFVVHSFLNHLSLFISRAVWLLDKIKKSENEPPSHRSAVVFTVFRKPNSFSLCGQKSPKNIKIASISP